MHELSIARNILAIVTDAAAGRSVRRINLEIGILSGVMPDAILFCFGAISHGTILHATELKIASIEGRAGCGECGTEFVTKTLYNRCKCGSRRVTLLNGEELTVKSIELEETA